MNKFMLLIFQVAEGRERNGLSDSNVKKDAIAETQIGKETQKKGQKERRKQRNRGATIPENLLSLSLCLTLINQTSERRPPN